MTLWFRRLFAALCIAAGVVSAIQAHAGSWPDRPITLVVPFAPGGSTDATARLLASELNGVLGKPVVVENRGGAGGNIGATFVARSAADGYTFLLATNAQAAARKLYRELQYDLTKDFTPVAPVVSFPNVLVVRSDFPAKTLKAFIAYVADKKGPMNYGSAGNGSSHHLATALFNRLVHGSMVHIPFKGGGPANVALLGGEVQMNIAPLVEVMPYINAGKLRPLGVTTTEPAALYPDVPAIDSVLNGFDIKLWSAVLAPSGTAPEIIEKMNAAVRKVLRKPDVEKKLEAMGYSIFDDSVQQSKDFFNAELERWGKMVDASGAQIN